MRVSLALGVLLLLQDPDAELLGRLQSIVALASDLDPAVRAGARKEATLICAEQGDALRELARGKRPHAAIVLTLAGKLDPAVLFKVPDRSARRVACDLLTPTKDQIGELLKLLDSKDPFARIAACRALGRITEPALQAFVSSALGHGLRRASSADLHFALISSMWHGSASFRIAALFDTDPERAGNALLVLCHLPVLGLTEASAPSLLRAAEADTVDRSLRSLMIRVVARRAPAAIIPLLTIRDRAFRSEIVERLENSLADPLLAPALLGAWKEARTRSLDDGGQGLLASRIESWLKRLCGDAVTPENFPQWMASKYRESLDERVDAAIRRASSTLRGIGGNQDFWKASRFIAPVGVCGLAAYSLLKCDVPPDDPAVVRALGTLLDREAEDTYSLSLTAMALAAALDHGAPRRERIERKLQRTADALVGLQTNSGGWTYSIGVGYDLSNTQFAVLGLRAAANGGAKVPRRTWERAIELLARTQGADGGWAYQGPAAGSSTPTMTAAGAYVWTVCRSTLDEKLTPEDLAQSNPIRLAFLSLDKALEPASVAAGPPYYLLYSLERLCMITSTRALGRRDWYVDGASMLLQAQGEDGLWRGPSGAVVDSCFALLFLRRAFIAHPSIATESGGPRAGSEQAIDVFERHREALSGAGIRDVRVGSDERTSFIRIAVDSEESVKSWTAVLGHDIEGVPLRFVVE